METGKILNGNCYEILKEIEDDSIDLVFTSPPYFNLRKYSESNDEIGQEDNMQEYIDNIFLLIKECQRIIKDTGSIVLNIGDKYENQSLSLIPYRIAIKITDELNLLLINDIIWSKINPTPSPHRKRLVSSKEPLFHFVKSKDYVYNLTDFMNYRIKKVKNKSENIGKAYFKLIDESSLSKEEKDNAKKDLKRAQEEVKNGEYTDFRMKIRGVHAMAYGGQGGGRNDQINNNGYTIIKMKGEQMKKDVLEYPVETIKGIKHPAVYPEEMVSELICLLTNEGDIVLDPFVGSGTTCVSALNMKRDFLGIDINDEFCEIARKRIKEIKKRLF